VLSRFWEGVADRLVERWAAVATPAILYWLGALGAYLLGHGGTEGLRTQVDWLSRQAGPVQLSVAVLALAAVGASGVLVQRLTLPALRFIEGYWPRWLAAARRRRVGRVSAAHARAEAAWSELAAKIDRQTATPDERTEFNRLDRRLRRVPSAPERVMPTRVGNILRASESRPVDRYGLDPVKCWTQLWLVLPDATRQELTAARASLDAAVAACVWGILFVVWSCWTWWAAGAGIAVAVLAYAVWLPGRAEVFADLLEATVDVHRTALYRAMRWPLPQTPRDERAAGEGLMTYLWRGSRADAPVFTAGPHDPPASG
jgi:hypothetical protein